MTGFTPVMIGTVRDQLRVSIGRVKTVWLTMKFGGSDNGS